MEKGMGNFTEQQTGVMKGNLIGKGRWKRLGRQETIINGKDGRRTDRLERQFLVVAPGMLPVVRGGFDKMLPDEIDKRNSLVSTLCRFRPVLGVVLEYIAHLG